MNASLASERPDITRATERVPINRYFVFAATAVLGLATDLATKAWFFAAPDLRAGDIRWLWHDHVGIQLSLNEGALFGFGQGRVWVFAALSIMAAIAIPTWLFWFRAARDWWLTVALGCVMAGVLGNLHDRLGWHGLIWPPPEPRAGQAVYAVRDWILWRVSPRWTWPNFNIADSLLVAGAGLLLLHALRQPQPVKSENDQVSIR